MPMTASRGGLPMKPPAGRAQSEGKPSASLVSSSSRYLIMSLRVMAQAPFPAANRPRPALRNREVPFLSRISRTIAALIVAAGVFPPVFHRPLLRMSLVRSAQPIGLPDPASTFAAASRPLIFAVPFGRLVRAGLADGLVASGGWRDCRVRMFAHDRCHVLRVLI